MGQVFAIAVVSALDAGLLTAAVVLLGRPQPARQLGAYLLGGMGLSIVFGLMIVLALHGSDLLHEIGGSTKGIVEVASGTLLLFVAISAGSGRTFQWHPQRKGKREDVSRQRQPLHERALGNDSLWIAWVAGAVYSIPGAYYLAGMALLAKLNAPVSADVFAVLGFNVIQFALIELPLIGLLVAPGPTYALTERLNQWMTAHDRVMIVVLAGAIGAYLLVSGVSDLS